MSAGTCSEPDPSNAELEPCCMSEGHGDAVPHLWAGRPCRHFRTRQTNAGTLCTVCGRTLAGPEPVPA